MSILSSLAIKSGIKGLGMAADAAGSVVNAAGQAAKGIASGVKNIAEAASAEDNKDGTKGVINNVGMVGRVGSQRVKAGAGTLPSLKKVAKPAYNESMSTEKLLKVAVSYLASIDNSLRKQLENDRLDDQRLKQAQKEADIENKNNAFKVLGSKFDNLVEKKPSEDLVKKLLIGGGLVAGLGAIGISQLDTKELDALKVNVEMFKQEYAWLVELGSFIGVGGLIGFLRGGVKGGLVGIVAEYVFEKLWYSSLNPFQPKDSAGNPIEAPTSMGKGALLVGAGAVGLAMGAKKIAPKIARAKSLLSSVRAPLPAGAAAAPSAAASGVRMIKGQQIGGVGGLGVNSPLARALIREEEATKKGLRWFATAKGKKFLSILTRKIGKASFKRIGAILGRIVGMVFLGATGIGSIPAIIGIIFNAGLLLYGLYEIASAIWDAWKESQVDTKSTPALPAGGTSVSSDTYVAAPGSGEAGQESYVPSGDQKVDFAMQYLMQNLDLKQFQAAGIVANLMAESGLDTNAFNSAGGGRGAYGIAQWRGPRQTGLDEFAAARGKRRDDFETQLAWIVQEMKTTHKDTLPALKATTTSADATTVFLDKYERPSAVDRASSLKKRISYGMAAERGTSLQTAQSTYEEPAALAAEARGASGGFSMASAVDMAKKIFSKAGGALVGAKRYEPRDINDTSKNISKQLNDMSKQIETATIAGTEQKAEPPGAVAATAAQKSIMQASNDGSLTAIDPNYPGNKEDTIMTYLAHWKIPE